MEKFLDTALQLLKDFMYQTLFACYLGTIHAFLISNFLKLQELEDLCLMEFLACHLIKEAEINQLLVH